MDGVAVLLSDIPKKLFGEHDIERRVHDRGGNVLEVRFLWEDPDPLLPVWDGGVFRLVRWGYRGGRGPLPPYGFTWRDTVEKGGWAGIGCPTEPCKIAANYGVDRGIWYLIREGIHGVLVTAPDGARHCYMMIEPPTRYYRVMTRSERMPSLINEVI